MSGFVIIVIAFIVLSNILRLAGKTGAAGKGTGVPRRPAPPRSRPNAAGGARRLPDGRTPLDLAATMIPEELWRVLTGQAPPAPPPSPAPRPREMQLELDDEIEEDEEAEIAAGRYAGEERSLEVADAGARTAADAAVRPASAAAKAPGGAASPAPSVASNAATTTLATAAAAPDRVRELRRAILLREVLGTPRGLE